MTSVTGQRLGPQRQRDIKGEKQPNTQSQPQHAGSGGKPHGDDCPFPNKPVSHRRLIDPQTHQSTDRYTSEKITHQPRDLDIRQKHCQYRTRDTAGTKKEIQLTKAIQEKQLNLQEKLWRVEEKIKHKLQQGNVEAAVKNDEGKSAERRQNGETKVTKTRQTKSAEFHYERKQGQVETINTTHHTAGSKQREREAIRGIQSKENRNYGLAVNADADKSQWEKVRERSRHSKDEGNRTEEGLKSRDGSAKQKQRQITGGEGLAGREKDCKRMYDDQADHEALWDTSVSRDYDEEFELLQNADIKIELIPCKICNRKFANERLEKHLQICKKVKHSQRQVFNSYLNRTRGSALEEFLKTHSRCKTPEVLRKKSSRKINKTVTKTVLPTRPPGGISQQKKSK